MYSQLLGLPAKPEVPTQKPVHACPGAAVGEAKTRHTVALPEDVVVAVGAGSQLVAILVLDGAPVDDVLALVP